MSAAPAASRHAHEQHIQAPGYADHRADHLARLSKIEGQIRGISRMVTGDRYCIDVLTQITAASRALQEVALSLLSTTTCAAASPTQPAPIPPKPRRSSQN